MASSVWKGYISFGLVSVPVRLFAAARESHVSFNQLHTPCGSRIKQQTVCPICDEKVERSDLSKGYEVDKDVYVTVTPEELKSLDSAASDTMNIEQFVSLKDIDPLYFQTSYYSVAEEPGRKVVYPALPEHEAVVPCCDCAGQYAQPRAGRHYPAL